MNDTFISYIKGKSIAVVGVGISNAPLVAELVKWGAKSVTLRDKKSKEELIKRFPYLAELENVKFICSENYLSDINEQLVIKTPGIRYDIPELLAAENSEISSETELFFRFSKCRKIAVTGSDGKTTTTTLIYEMLKADGKKVLLGGNIGTPLLYRINSIDDDAVAVLELSSFQLHTQKYSPETAVITNISPNHLDWHKSFDEYRDAKANIFLHQNKDGICVLNADNENSKPYFAKTVGKVRTFTKKGIPENDGAYLSNGMIMYKEGEKTVPVLDTKKIRIPGNHNIENYMTAICAVWGTVSVEAVNRVAESFTGVAHRLQLIREKDGVKYYNSSIDSSPSRTNAALSSFKTKNTVIILGGKDKNVPFDSLAKELSEKTKYAVLTGAAADKIYDDVSKTDIYKNGGINFVKEPDWEKAIKLAASLAESGDNVLLSPACTSFDRFMNFEKRGEFFADIVNSL